MQCSGIFVISSLMPELEDLSWHAPQLVSHPQTSIRPLVSMKDGGQGRAGHLGFRFPDIFTGHLPLRRCRRESGITARGLWLARHYVQQYKKFYDNSIGLSISLIFGRLTIVMIFLLIICYDVKKFTFFCEFMDFSLFFRGSEVFSH